MTLFVSAVDEGSLAAAARRHGRSPAAVTRAVALLERHAGDVLLLRSTRKLSLTPTGERHVALWREVLTKLREIEPDPTADALKGHIVLTAPELFGRMKIMPILGAFLQEHPGVEARLLMANHLVDLTGEGVDLAVRLAPLTDSTLKAVKVGEVRILLCASPDYVARAGSPARPSDLGQHECIGLTVGSDGELWQFIQSPGADDRAKSVRVHTRLSTNSAAASIDEALRGHGIVRVRSYQVADHIAAGRLVRVLPLFEPPSTPVCLIFQPDRARNGPVRALIDYLVPNLKRELSEISAMVPSR